jgi:FeS assembly SUF system protein
MSEEYKNPNAVAHLPVLPNSGKVDQLRQEPPIEKHSEPRTAEIPATAASDPLRSIEYKLLEGRIIEALRQVYDPEIPVSIYDLGLIYKIAIADDKSVKITMTLTAPGCPVAGSLPGEVEKKVEAIPEVKEAEVELVWEPTWDKSMMSEAAQLQLGF